MDIWPISFYWIDQNEDIAAAMGWRWLTRLGQRCVEKSREAAWPWQNHNALPSCLYEDAAVGIWVAEMHWLPPYTYPNSVDTAPIRRSYGTILPPEPPVTLHCALVHACIVVPNAGLEEIDAWNVALMKTGEELSETIYPHAGDESGSYWPATFATWRYSAYRAVHEWQYKHERWHLEPVQRKVLP